MEVGQIEKDQHGPLLPVLHPGGVPCHLGPEKVAVLSPEPQARPDVSSLKDMMEEMKKLPIDFGRIEKEFEGEPGNFARRISGHLPEGRISLPDLPVLVQKKNGGGVVFKKKGGVGLEKVSVQRVGGKMDEAVIANLYAGVLGFDRDQRGIPPAEESRLSSFWKSPFGLPAWGDASIPGGGMDSVKLRAGNLQKLAEGIAGFKKNSPVIENTQGICQGLEEEVSVALQKGSQFGESFPAAVGVSRGHGLPAPLKSLDDWSLESWKYPFAKMQST
jgi:hypothetical protein